MTPRHLRFAGVLAASMIAVSGSATLAVDGTPPSTAVSPESLRNEIARGAREVTAVTLRRWPRPTIYRSIRLQLEVNVQNYQDSEAFRLGAHLATALWLQELPEDVTWREKAL